MADFEVCASVEEQPVCRTSGGVEDAAVQTLLPYNVPPTALPEQAPAAVSEPVPKEPNIHLFECSDREAEIRIIAKESSSWCCWKATAFRRSRW